MPDSARFIAPTQGPVSAVVGWGATEEQRARALSPIKARQIVGALSRNAARDALVDLYTLAQGARPFPLGSVKTETMVAAIQPAIDSGRLLLLDGWDGGTGGSGGGGGGAGGDYGTPEQVLVRKVLDKRTTIGFQGKRYSFAPADDWFRTGQEHGSEFRVLSRADAMTIVDGMILAKVPGSAEDRDSWNALAGNLADRRGDDGIVVLRYEPRGMPTARRSVEAASTPSQLRPKEDDWIELEVVYEDGTPYEGNCSLELPGGRKSDGPPSDKGIIRVDGLTTGSCKLSFPDLDGSSWEKR
jgi:hypothetical protein